MAMEEAREAVGDYKEGWQLEHSTIRFDSGLSEEVVRKISKIKNEPEWMTEIRVKAYHHFVNRPMPGFGDREALEGIDFDKVCYYLRSLGCNRERLGRCPRGHQEYFRSSWHTRSRTEMAFRGYGTIRIRSSLSQHKRRPRVTGGHISRHGQWPQRASGASEEVFL